MQLILRRAILIRDATIPKLTSRPKFAAISRDAKGTMWLALRHNITNTMHEIHSSIDLDVTKEHLVSVEPKLCAYRNLISAQRMFLRDAWNRLKWDMRPSGWKSRQRLVDERDRFGGQSAVIVCNGPSLLRTRLELLSGTYSIGLNKINLLFDKSPFRPSCIVAVNRLVLEQNRDFYNQTELPLYVAHRGADLVRFRGNVRFMHATMFPRFARDVSGSVNEGGTVTFVAMQLAFHLGFRRVALVGCDHRFAVQGAPNATVVGGEKDESHFDPNYFGRGIQWQLPDLVHMEMAYRLARGVYETHGRELVNCTVGGNLEVLKRMPLEDFLKGT